MWLTGGWVTTHFAVFLVSDLDNKNVRTVIAVNGNCSKGKSKVLECNY